MGVGEEFLHILISLYAVVKRSTKLQQHTDFKKKSVKSIVLQVSGDIIMNLKSVAFFVVHDFFDNRFQSLILLLISEAV